MPAAAYDAAASTGNRNLSSIMSRPSELQSGPAGRIAEVMAALSLASDLGSGYGEEQGLRSTLVAQELGEALGLDRSELRDLYDLSLLRMIGCTADSPAAAEALGDEILVGGESARLDMGNQREAVRWLFREFGRELPIQQRVSLTLKLLTYRPENRRQQLAAHCEVASTLACELGRSQRVAAALGQVFERWDGRGVPAALKGEAIDPLVRIVTLAADLAIFAAAAGMEEALAVCRRRAGGLHDPTLIDLLGRRSGGIDERLRSNDVLALVLDAEPRPHEFLEPEMLDRACAAIGAFADMKSRFTAGRSTAVAERALAAGSGLGLPAPALDTLNRAALVHDLGRVAVTAAIWDRPGPLPLLQREQVRLFPLHGERLLGRASALRPEARLVGLQRELLDGSGYPRGQLAPAIPIEARLLGTISAYVAMREARAWRPALSREAAAAELRAGVQAGRMDRRVVDAVLEVDVRRTRGRPRVEALTERETEVLRLLAAGASNREIGSLLSISSRTAEHHVGSLYSKLGVRSRAAATLWAARAGLTTIDD